LKKSQISSTSNLLKRSKSIDVTKKNYFQCGKAPLKNNLDNFPPSLRKKRKELNDAELIWQQKVDKLDKKLTKSFVSNSRLKKKLSKIQCVNSDLQNALALNSA